MGSRGAGSGRNANKGSAGRVSPTAQTVDLDSIVSQVLNKGEGSFIRTDIPTLVRADSDNGLEIHTEKGYATVVEGVPVFIQGGAGKGYSYNVYGMTASRQPMKTLNEAKNPDSIKQVVDRVKSAYNDVGQMKEVFDAANRKGGMTMDEYTQIVRRNRAKKG